MLTGKLGLAGVLLTAATTCIGAVESEPDPFDLSLGELLSLEITSVSKRSQPVSQAAAAIFVITGEDIRRSGVTTIPEALRMAPGLQVGRIDSNKWAVSARGFNGRFANKLLVLMDGRALYTPLFSGVFWDVQDTLLDDIERIEVIRGPGATLWGANAVNGVINIITKSAADTQGGLVSAGTGSQEHGFTSLRYGGTLGDRGHYRVYGKQFRRDGSEEAAAGRDTADDWDQVRGGFRVDLDLDRGGLTVLGNIYAGDSGETVDTPTLAPPFLVRSEDEQDVSGYNLLARLDREVSAHDQFRLQGYVDHTDRDWAYLGEKRTTFDLEFEYRTQRIAGHDILFGVGYRRSSDEVDNSAVVRLDPDERDSDLFSVFIQDDIVLVPDRWALVVGSKFEHNDYTGFEYQPNLRLLFTPDERHSLWASVARAVRTPGRADHDSRVLVTVLPPGTASNPTPLPLATPALGNGDVGSEELIAYEAGFKWQASPTLSMDLALFYNDYDSLRSAQLGAVTCEPAGGTPPLCFFDPRTTHLAAPAVLGEKGSGRTRGLELATDWRPSSRWRLQTAYTYLDVDLWNGPGHQAVDLEGRNPRHQVSMRSWLNLRSDVELDLWLRHVSELEDAFAGRTVDVDAYTELDVRVAWRPRKGMELALVGRNLLDDGHEEYFSDLGDVPLTEVQRSAYVQLRLTF